MSSTEDQGSIEREQRLQRRREWERAHRQSESAKQREER